MRILFIGDIVGRSGRNILLDRMPKLIAEWKLDLVVVNGENAAGGFGITEAIYNDLIDAGADAITLGNHAWDQREALVFIERAPRLIRPINYPPGTPGRGAAMIDTKNGARALVINAMGRIFMEPLDDPFAAIERELAACPLKSGADAIIVDMHCEATSEKQSMGYLCDGRASLVIGTHTHAPTADHRILPGGTAFMSDVGMTGDYQSVIGMDKDEPLGRFLRRISTSKFEAGQRSGDVVARSRSRPTTRPGLPPGSVRCGSAACWKRRSRRSGAKENAHVHPRCPVCRRPCVLDFDCIRRRHRARAVEDHHPDRGRRRGWAAARIRKMPHGGRNARPGQDIFAGREHHELGMRAARTQLCRWQADVEAGLQGPARHGVDRANSTSMPHVTTARRIRNTAVMAGRQVANSLNMLDAQWVSECAP